MLRILLTNDDGINAPGLGVLRRIAADLSDDVWVVAPETDQSGLSHSLSLSNPLRLRQIEDKVFALRGTPTDCVIMGVREIVPDGIDLILSGVNSGHNISDDVTYSGTIAAAMEGTLLKIPSIALSQGYDWNSGDPIPWDTATTHGSDVVRAVLAVGITADTLINVNFPDCSADAVAGRSITRQGQLTHGLYLDKRQDGLGNPYFWLSYRRQPQEIIEGTDLAALRQNRISITPIRMDLTADAELARYQSLTE